MSEKKAPSVVKLQSGNIGMKYLQYLDINMYFMVLPLIALEFLRISYWVRFTTSLYFFSFGFAVFFSGVVIDYWGVKRVTKIVIPAFMLGNLIGYLPLDYGWFVVGRFISGFCLGFLPTIVRVVTSRIDLSGMPRLLMAQTIFVSWAPAVAMLVAGFFSMWFGWRSIYLFLIAFSLLLFIYLAFLFRVMHPDVNNESKGSLLTWLKNYRELLANRVFVCWILACAFVASGVAVYFLLAMFLFSHTLHYSHHVIGVMMLSIFAAMFVSSFLGRPLLTKLGKQKLTCIGLALMVIGAVAMLVLALLFPPVWWAILMPMLVYMLGFGFVSPLYIGNACALSSSVSVAAGTALMATAHSLVNTINGALVAHFSIVTALPMSIYLLVLLAIALVLSLVYLKLAANQ